MILEEQFPVPRNNSVGKIGNSVISLLIDNSDVIATLIITNFRLYLIQLWWQFFQNFVYGDVVYAQTWGVLALKNCIEPPQGNSISIQFFGDHNDIFNRLSSDFIPVRSLRNFRY